MVREAFKLAALVCPLVALADSGGNPPAITDVLDAGSYTANIAEGGVFVVKGTNLSPTGLGTDGALSASYPLETSSNGVSINFASATGGSPVQAYIVYLYNSGGVNQLAGTLPSTLSPGNYNVTVSNGAQTSDNFAVQVVASKPGLITQDSTGGGLAVVQNYVSQTELDIDRYTSGAVDGSLISPAHPGQVLTAWATGLGPVPFADNTAPDGGQGYNFLTQGANVTVYVGGMAISGGAIAYAGRAPCCAGEDQIDFTLPASVPTGCFEPFQVSINGNLSQVAVLSVAPAGSSACASPQYTTSQLQSFDNGASSPSGLFSLNTLETIIPGTADVTTYEAVGVFVSFSGLEVAGAAGTGATSPQAVGTCVVTPSTPSTSGVSTTPKVTSTTLDAGQITLSGPSASNLNNSAFTESLDNGYQLAIGQVLSESGVSVQNSYFGNGVLGGGAYTVDGDGGKGVGPFNATLTLGPPYSVTGGLPSTVDRGSSLTVSWTGGNSTDGVAIEGASSTGTSPNLTGALFTCVATAASGSFTVPPSILNQLPAGLGTLAFSAAATSVFTAPLTAGGSVGSVLVGSTVIINDSVTYQ